MQKSFFLFLACYGLFSVHAQWNPSAGIIPSFTDNATITSSSPGSGLQNVIDNNVNTAWQSDAPLPSGFVNRPDQNKVYQQGATICSGTGSNYAVITDGNTNTANTINLQGGKAMLNMNLGTATQMYSISMKMSTSNPVDVYAFFTPTDSILVTSYMSTDNYAWKRFNLPTTAIQSFKWYCTSSFQVFEVAIMADLPQEWAVVDLGSMKNIGQIVTRHWSGGATNATATDIYVSADNINWTHVSSLVHDALQPIITQVIPTLNARYIKVAHTLTMTDWNKVYLWEIDAYNSDGMYGAFPTAVKSPAPFKSVLGVNGIWGWGHNAYSTSLGANQGPRLYNQAARHARNYHAMSWDVTDPDIKPDYATMAAGGGTQGQWWLNWDTEYQDWVNAGLKIQASIQFLYPAAAWDSAYISAYEYGYEFAKHFGPTFGTGNIEMMEVGNEPWELDSTLYKTILDGMAKGAKDADPAMQVIPCALQAVDPSSDLLFYNQNYMGTRVKPSNAPYLDGLNVHAYSYVNNAQGVRVATFPEDPKSDIKSILAAIRFRNQNMPGKKIFWSEYGWDADGGVESCTHNECVGERAGTAYAIRAAMMGWRWGMDRMTWFFYANDVSGSSLYTRSGLTTSKNDNFQKKKVFTAFEALLANIEDSYFLGIIKEDSTAWIYELGDSLGNVTQLIAWRPIEGSITNTSSVNFAYTHSPLSAVKLEGLNPLGETIPTPSYNMGMMTADLGSVPIIIKVDGSTNIENALAQSSLKIYPNPASDLCYIESAEAIQSLQIFDALGRKVWEKTWELSINAFSFDTKPFAKGLYSCKIATKKGEIVRKLWIGGEGF